MLRKARGSSEADKLVVVKAIYENKRLLLGDFDDSKGITKNAKQEKWKAIFGQLQAIDILSNLQAVVMHNGARFDNFGREQQILRSETSFQARESILQHTKGALNNSSCFGVNFVVVLLSWTYDSWIF